MRFARIVIDPEAHDERWQGDLPLFARYLHAPVGGGRKRLLPVPVMNHFVLRF
jgi:hypothetical protein